MSLYTCPLFLRFIFETEVIKVIDKEYYEYICSLSNTLYFEHECDARKFDKIIRKIDKTLQKAAKKGKEKIYLDFSLDDFMETFVDYDYHILIDDKYRDKLKKTLYKRLDNGGFVIINLAFCDVIIWNMK